MKYCAFVDIAKSRVHLKLHFMSFEAMSSVMNSILEAQGFENRLAQYEHVSNLPNALLCSRSTVKHKLTGCEYELRWFDKRDEANFHVFN